MTIGSVFSAIGKLLTRLFVATLGTGIALWGCYDIIVTDRANPVPPPVAHYILIGVIVVLGLGLAGGKHTTAVISSITAWTRAWRGGAAPPPDAPPGTP